MMRHTLAIGIALLTTLPALTAACPTLSEPIWTPGSVAEARTCAKRADLVRDVHDRVSDETPTCPGIRPGARILAPEGCTASFVWRAEERVFLGTAGHCAQVGDRVTLAGEGEVGTVVYSHQDARTDFALIEIDAERRAEVTPEMCHWGGPTGPYVGEGTTEAVLHFGHGTLTGTTPVTRARAGLPFEWTQTRMRFAGAALPGDSGSPVILATGEAVGVLNTGPVSGVGVMRLAHQVAAAEAALGIDLALATAPLRRAA